MTSLGGCSSIYYVYQAGRGQLKLLNRARPVEEVIEDPRTSPDLVSLLKKIPAIKAYGEKEGLRPTKNYRDYVNLDQNAVVYVVTVSDALAFKPKIFSFPIVGSFNYIGWFGLDDAKKFASTFEAEGYDVDVRGASAYSTLGWFRDPLLSTMIPKEQDSAKISPIW
jgi:predicted aminopeptidase